MSEAEVDGFNVDYALRGVGLPASAEHVSPVLRERGHLQGGATPGARPASGTLRGRILGTDALRADHPGAAFRLRGLSATSRRAG